MIETAISGTTDGSGLLTINITNSFTLTPYIISNISGALAANNMLTVQDRTNTTIVIMVRNKNDNAAVTNTAISSRALIVGV